jgi:hypothetical protein
MRIKQHLFMLVPLLWACSGHAAASMFAAGMQVSGILDQLTDSTQQIIDTLDNRVSARSFQLRTDLVVLQSELRHSADGLLNKTFGELNKQQQAFFEGAATSIAAAKAASLSTTSEISQIVSQIDQAIARVPFADAEPRVRRVTPGFFNANDSTTTRTISIDGSFLRHGPANLSIGSANCNLVGQTDVQLTFSCLARSFPSTATKVTFLSGELVVTEQRSLWKRVKNWFGGEADTKIYRLPLAIVPATLGTYAITATYTTTSSQHRDRSAEWGATNPHCVGRRNYIHNFGPSGTGWKIDVSSISTAETCGRGNQGHAVRNANEAGFQVESWTSNSGNCVRVAGQTVSRDARGCSIGTVRWREFSPTTELVTKEISTGQLTWGKSVAVRLPEGLQGFLVTVEQIDGRRIVLNSAVPSSWFSLSRDTANTSLVISPQDLSRALTQ